MSNLDKMLLEMYVDPDIYRQVSEQERLRSVKSDWVNRDSAGQLSHTDFYDDLYLLKRFEKIAKEIAATPSRSKAAELVSETGGLRAGNLASPMGTHLTKIEKALVALCHAFDPEMLKRHRNHVFNPLVQAVVDALCTWPTDSEFCKAPHGEGPSIADKLRLDEIENNVRETSKSRAFMRQINHELKLASQDLNSACTYFSWLFAYHARLLIARVDLYFHAHGEEEAEIHEGDAAFERFLRMLRIGRIVPNFLGYMVSREVAPQRGLHFHVMAIMNGEVLKDASCVAQTIGDRWVKEYAPPEHGSHLNCYLSENEDDYNGLRLVHVSDCRKLVALMVAMENMTNWDYLIAVRRSRKQRRFRCGQVKTLQVKHGSPRQSEGELPMVRRILGHEARFSRSKQ